VILIFGVRGTGKSYTLGNIVEGLIEDGAKVSTGCNRKALVLFDTLGHFWQMKSPPPDSETEQTQLLKDWGLNKRGFENVEVFTPAGFPGAADKDWKEFALAYSDMEIDDWCGLIKMNQFDDPMGQLMSDAYAKVVTNGWDRIVVNEDETVTSEHVEANPAYTITDLVDCIENDVIIRDDDRGFARATIRGLLARLTAMASWGVFSATGTSIEEIFRRGVLTIIKLNSVPDNLKTLIAGLVVKKIFKNRALGKEKEELMRIKGEEFNEDDIFPEGWVLIDEAHNYCPTTGISSSKEWLIKFVKEGRSYGLGLVGTTQQPSALDGDLTSQVNVLICHSLAFAQDIQAARDRLLNLDLKKVEIDGETYDSNVLANVLRSLENGEAIISTRDTNRVFVSRIRPRLAAHGGGHPQVIDL
jgi:DNA helicase HerA-like ATPase